MLRKVIGKLNALLGEPPAKTVSEVLAGFAKCSISKTFVHEEYFTVSYTNDDFTLHIGEKVHFRKYCHLLVYPKASLLINDGVFFNNYCSVNCLGQITIGANTLFGEGVKLYDHNHQYKHRDGSLQVERYDFSIGKIKIGENCWIGSNVTILKDVEIGDNVIIGANCLIHKSIPSNSIVKINAGLSIESIPDA